MRYVLIALLFVASTADAENWQQIGKPDSNGGMLLFDAARITEVKGLRRAWIKSVYTSDQPIPTDYQGAVPNIQSYRSELSARYFNCPERTSAVMSYYWRSADEKVVGHYNQALLTFHKVPAGTLDEQMLETVCNFAGGLVDAAAAGVHVSWGAKMTRPVNPDDYYPLGSRRRGEQGSPMVRVCVGPSGKLLREPEVTETSGFPDLDGAAIKVAKATRYAAGTDNGTPVPESCLAFKIKFTVKK